MATRDDIHLTHDEDGDETSNHGEKIHGDSCSARGAPLAPWLRVRAGLALHDRRDGAPDQHSRLAHASCDHLGHGLGRHGYGESHLLGLVHGCDLGYRDFLWCAADCDLGPWNVRSVKGHERTEPGPDDGSTLCRCDPSADALGSHVLRTTREWRLHHGD